MNTNQIRRLIRIAHKLDLHGQHHVADAITRQLLAGIHNNSLAFVSAPTRSAQQSMPPANSASQVWNIPHSQLLNPQEGGPESASQVWNIPHQNAASGPIILSDRIQTLKNSVDHNTLIPAELRQALSAQLQVAVSLLSQNQPVMAKRHGLLRTSEARNNVAGLESQFEVVGNLVKTTIGDQPTLVKQVQQILETCKRYIKQYEDGVSRGFVANDAAQNGQGVPSPVEGLPMQKDSGGNWLEAQGTTFEYFLARCREWAAQNGGVSALAPHLQEEGVPNSVSGEILHQIEPSEVFNAI